MFNLMMELKQNFIKDLLNEIHKRKKQDITFGCNYLKKPIFKFKKNLFDCKDGYKILKISTNMDLL